MKKAIKQLEKRFHPQLGVLEETYWAPYSACGLCVDKEFYNEDTKKWEKRKIIGETGHPKMSGGNYVYLTEDVKFTNFQDSAGMINKKEASSWCFYLVYEKTPQYIKNRLAQEHAIKNIMTNDEKEKSENPQAFEKALQTREVLAENKSLQAQIEAANRRIKELEGKPKKS